MPLDVAHDAESPFHPGEVELQRSLGVADRMREFGRRVVRDYMPDQHRHFYAKLPFIVLGTLDERGDVWATLRSGEPGFMASPDPQTLSLLLRRDPSDPAQPGLEDGASIGMLGIEPDTRRRNRMNGRVRRVDAQHLDVHVQHAFGNCPQYIQGRSWRFEGDPAQTGSSEVTTSVSLDERAKALIGGADTFFVASYAHHDGETQVDVSHRGGKPGFVRIDDDGGLTIPDFAGNLHFNTLGNFLLNPRAGLLFADFERGHILQMTGRAEVLLNHPDIAAFQGAERLWRFFPERIVYRESATPLRWWSTDASPNVALTGDWDEARRRREAAESAQRWRPFRVASTVDESSVVRSFHLEPADGLGLVPHQAGQHLPIRVRLPGASEPTIRSYTISKAPSDGGYRISVKRDGLVSTHLHDAIGPGDVIEVRRPAGAFTIDPKAPRPAVLIAAGIGITPILAMLRHLVYEGRRTRKTRRAYVFYGARNGAERAFDGELQDLVAQAASDVTLVRAVSAPAEGDAFDVRGRVDIGVLQRFLPFGDYDFYLCGPPAFMQSLHDDLRRLAVGEDRIHAEAFGPAALERSPSPGQAKPAGPPPATSPVPVAFARSGKEARWKPGHTLLEIAESRGLTPEFSCRVGSCGSCSTRVLSGRVAYPNEPTARVAEGEALICCSVPAAGQADAEPLVLDV